MDIAHISKMHEGSELLKPVGRNVKPKTTKPKYVIRISDETKAHVINTLKDNRGLRADEIAKAIGFGIAHTKKILTLMKTNKLIDRTMTNEKSKFGAFLYYDIDDPDEMPNREQEEADMILNYITRKGKVRNPVIEAALDLSSHRIRLGLEILTKTKKISKLYDGKSGRNDVYAYELKISVV